VSGPPGTSFRIAFNWNESVDAFSNDPAKPAIGAETTYSSFDNISAYANPGQSDAKTVSGQGIDIGVTSGKAIASGGLTYSLAKSYRLTGSVGTNGKCYTCDIVPGCCDCGIGTTTSMFNATVFP
jgi:hypothetical protein